MDPSNASQLGNQSNSMVEHSKQKTCNGPSFENTCTDQKLVYGNGDQICSYQEQSTGGEFLPPNQPFVNGSVPDSANINDDHQEDCDFSNEVFGDQICSYQEQSTGGEFFPPNQPFVNGSVPDSANITDDHQEDCDFSNEVFWDQIWSYQEQSTEGEFLPPNQPFVNGSVPNSANINDDHQEDCDFSNEVFGDQICSYQEQSTGGEFLPPNQPFVNGSVPDSANINDDYQEDCDFSNEVFWDQIWSYQEQSTGGEFLPPNQPFVNGSVPNSANINDDHQEDCDFLNEVFEDQICSYQEQSTGGEFLPLNQPFVNGSVPDSANINDDNQEDCDFLNEVFGDQICSYQEQSTGGEFLPLNQPFVNGSVPDSANINDDHQEDCDFSNDVFGDQICSYQEQSTGGEFLLPNQPFVNGSVPDSANINDDHQEDCDFSNEVFGDQICSYQEQSSGGEFLPPNQPFVNGSVPDSEKINDDHQEDCDFSNEMLRYIEQMLMAEDKEDETLTLQESLDLQATEKSSYEVLGLKYPPSPQPNSGLSSYYNESLDDNRSSGNGSDYRIDIHDPSWMYNHTSLVQSRSTYNVANSYVSSSNSLSNFTKGFSDSPASHLQIRNIYSESHYVSNFNKGVEEASKFLPCGNKLSIYADNNGLLTERESVGGTFELEKKNEGECSRRGKKNSHSVETDLEEERSSKLPSIISDYSVPIEEFDALLLHSLGERREKFAAYRADLQSEAAKQMQQNAQRKEFGVAKGRGKKPNNKNEVIDLQTLLITCAREVTAGTHQTARELLKQIRHHSSPFGDGNQRLAHYFADGLEARLTGYGSKMHKAIVIRRTTAADYLKAYYTYIASSPFQKISSFASNRTIIEKSQKATRVHVIDFGILYGFQWPTFIQRISSREGGPPRLRITGIDFPQPGFRPAEKIEDTGRRLARYAQTFNVPFEYRAIAQNWENIKLEDLMIEEDEFVVVTCFYRSKNLLDETLVAESSKTRVLKLIRSINPAIFIHGIVNGAYSAPFFVTRFREVLFHFSALFDMLENTIPREKPERLQLERDIFGPEALNVIACEGSERVERPETYKQWQVRNLKAGFMQVRFDREVMSKAIERVRSFYHKDFMIGEDNRWLLLGWKGRIIKAISCWKPA